LNLDAMLADLQANPEQPTVHARVAFSTHQVGSVQQNAMAHLKSPSLSVSNTRWQVRLADLKDPQKPTHIAEIATINSPASAVKANAIAEAMAYDDGIEDIEDDELMTPVMENTANYANLNAQAFIVAPIAKPTTVKAELSLVGKDWWSLVGKEVPSTQSQSISQGRGDFICSCHVSIYSC
jgi:hypothetical protein